MGYKAIMETGVRCSIECHAAISMCHLAEGKIQTWLRCVCEIALRSNFFRDF